MDIRMYFDLKHLGGEISPDIKRHIRAKLREPQDKLAKNIKEGWRKVYADESGEVWYEYRILNGKLRDEEIEEYAGYIWRNFYGPYDCTGQPVTQWIRWKRVPAGIILVHKLALDV